VNAPPEAGALLDARYRVGSVIARGGMSTVYRGTDTRLDRPVAVKIMDSRLAADPAFRMRFEREARSAARIDHPAVVDVFDQGTETSPGGDTLFIVMELVEGCTLRDVLRARDALGVPAAFAVLEAVLLGLAEAHRLGMVHRDVKPENVLISDAREVKVADFGLVVAAAQAGASHAGLIMGTVAYLSPEQVATGTADARSDVYAAGIMLYEMLTGEPPYSGDTAISVAYRHVNSDVPPPSLIAGDVPPELDALVRRATSRDPAGRPADASAMLAELRRVAVVLAVPRVPPPAPPRRAAEQPTLPAAPSPARPGGTRAMERDGIEPDGPPPHLRARRRGRRMFAVWIAVVLLLALGVGLTAWWLGTGRWTSMPTVVGLQQTAAERLLADADLVPRSTTSLDDAQAAGVVIRTDPVADARLLRGSTVAIVVSLGRPAVPAVAAGTAVADAEKAVRAATLNPVRSTAADEYSATVPDGAVIRTDPAAGTLLGSGGPVTLVISRGAAPPPPPAQVQVPFVIGSSYREAKAALEAVGLKAEEVKGFPFGRRNGNVVNQSAGAGSMVDRGTTVSLTTF
jgi:eukaryotic-like serine/threonine-protein kinase